MIDHVVGLISLFRHTCQGHVVNMQSLARNAGGFNSDPGLPAGQIDRQGGLLPVCAGRCSQVNLRGLPAGFNHDPGLIHASGVRIGEFQKETAGVQGNMPWFIKILDNGGAAESPGRESQIIVAHSPISIGYIVHGIWIDPPPSSDIGNHVTVLIPIPLFTHRNPVRFEGTIKHIVIGIVNRPKTGVSIQLPPTHGIEARRAGIIKTQRIPLVVSKPITRKVSPSIAAVNDGLCSAAVQGVVKTGLSDVNKICSAAIHDHRLIDGLVGNR